MQPFLVVIKQLTFWVWPVRMEGLIQFLLQMAKNVIDFNIIQTLKHHDLMTLIRIRIAYSNLRYTKDTITCFH